MLKKIREMKDEDGFTLIELMVVVLIIAILIAIALPTFLGLRQRAQDRAAQSDLRNGLAAAKAFYTDDETYSPGGVAFDAADGEDIEPSLDWVDAAPTTGQLEVATVTSAAGTELVQLVRESESDQWFCIQDSNGVTGYGDGTTRAAALGDCASGAW